MKGPEILVLTLSVIAFFYYPSMIFGCWNRKSIKKDYLIKILILWISNLFILGAFAFR